MGWKGGDLCRGQHGGGVVDHQTPKRFKSAAVVAQGAGDVRAEVWFHGRGWVVEHFPQCRLGFCDQVTSSWRRKGGPRSGCRSWL